MSTIGSLLLGMDAGIKPYNEQELTANRIQFGTTQNQTQLLELAELRRQQEAQQLARQYYQQNPSVLLGDQGQPQSILGGLAPQPGGVPGAIQQQTYRPGEAPTTQTVPAPMQPNANMGGMPGGPPQSILGSLAPQPQGGALEQLMRQNPDAAFAVMQQQQQQQANRLKFDEQRLTMGIKVAEYVGRVAQGVTSPETLEHARQELARIHPQAASQLPQVYSKEAMLPFITKAMSVKDSAQLRLETWKAQMENQRLGLQGEPAAMVSELRAMGVNPLQATPEQRQQAQKNIQQREVELKMKEGYGTKQAELEANKEFRQTQTVGEVFKNDLPSYYDTRTGRAIPTKMQYKDYAALPQGAVKQVSDDERKQQENVNSAMPRLQILQSHIDAVYGPGGALERMSPADRELLRSPLAIPTQVIDQFAQKYPELAAAQKYIEANAESLARALSGVRGAATEDDVNRAKAMLPNLTATLKVWPLGQAGLSLPDTRETALRTMNNLVDTLNGISGSILGSPHFEHPLHRYETPANVPGPGLRAGEGSFRLQPGDVLPPSSNTKPVGPGPTPPGTPAGPAQGAFGTPPQTRYVPGEAPAPAPSTRPAPPTAGSTPAQDEAYRQSVAPQPASPSAPSAPASRPTPGRQSQAPPAAGQTRVAGGPKYMDLADVAEAMRQTGKSRREVEAAARARGYTVYGSKLPFPTALA